MNISKWFLIITVALGSTFVWSEQDGNKDVLIGISFSIPPYVIKEQNDGLELAILKRCFAVKGYNVLPSYLPLGRTFMSFQEGSLGGVINVKKGAVDGYYSDVVITFRNVAVSLKERNIEIAEIKDLSRKSIVAFQRATIFLDDEFKEVVKNNSEYKEVADQSLQIKQLFRYRTEVIVLEKKIFKYFRKHIYERSISLKDKYIISEKEVRKPVVYHDIFSPTDYRFAFLSEKVRDDFNEGLRLIRANGEFDEIMKKYDDDLELPPIGSNM